MPAFRRHRIERALQIVGDIEHVARKAGNAIGPRIGDLAAVRPQVFHLRKRPQHPVASTPLTSFASASAEPASGSSGMI